jgi:hypothetical protein
LRGNVLVTNSGESKLKNWSNEIQDFPPSLKIQRWVSARESFRSSVLDVGRFPLLDGNQKVWPMVKVLAILRPLSTGKTTGEKLCFT